MIKMKMVCGTLEVEVATDKEQVALYAIRAFFADARDEPSPELPKVEPMRSTGRGVFVSDGDDLVDPDDDFRTYHISRLGNDPHKKQVAVYGDEALRDRIVFLLSKYGR